MKKLLFTLLLLAAASATMSAYDFERYGIYYKVINGNEVSVVAGENPYTGDVHIPSWVYYGASTEYSVTTIGSDAFNDCYGLTLVRIPASVTTIEANAFAGCYGLQTIVFQGLTPPSTTEAFGADPYNYYQTTLYVPGETIENYYYDEFWGQFPNIQGLYQPRVTFDERGDELTIRVFGMGILEVVVNGSSIGTCEGSLTYKMQRQSSNYFHVSVCVFQDYDGHSSAYYSGYDSRYDTFTTLPMLYASLIFAS